MYRIISEGEFYEGLKDSFTYEGACALFEHLEIYEDESENTEYDPVAFRCSYTEYENIEEYNRNYNTEHEGIEDIDETIVIPIDDVSFIVQDY